MCRSTTCCRASLGTMRLSSSLHPTPPSRSRASTSSVCVCVCGVHVCIVVSVYACVRSSFARHTQGWQGRGGSPTRAPRPATPSDPGRPAQPGSQRLTYIVWVINARSLVTSIKFFIGCLCTLLLPSDAMLCHCFTVYP